MLRHLRDGGLVVFPTDTLYGLGGIPSLPRVVERIYELKRRDRGKPFPLLVDDVDRALSFFAEVTPVMRKLVERFWPGKLTIVSMKKKDSSLPGDESRGTVGLRVPGCFAARKLARLAGGVIIGTSANLSGEEPILSFAQVLRTFDSTDLLLIDGGDLLSSRGSTVVEVVGNEVKMIREGDVSFGEIEKTIRE